MRKLIILPVVVLLMLTVSCAKEREVSVPDILINEADFTNILIDIHKTDALLSNKRLHDKNLKDSTASYYNYVYNKHSINRMQFNENLEYYSNKPKILENIYINVVDSLEKEAYELQKRISN